MAIYAPHKLISTWYLICCGILWHFSAPVGSKFPRMSHNDIQPWKPRCPR